MKILTVKDAGNMWGISARRVSALCEQGRISGAEKVAGVWILPGDSKKPKDARIKNRKYVNWRCNINMSSNNYQDNLKNLKGTFAVEGINISKESISNLKRLSSGTASCSELVEELKQKYTQGV